MNPHLKDEIYRVVGEEIARNEYHPGPMARAVAEAQGNRDLVESLYIRFRHEEVARQFEHDAPRRRADALERNKRGLYDCPCGFSGEPTKKARGSVLLTLVLLCVYVIPGLIYAIVFSGYKGICPDCGRTVAAKL